MKLLNRSAVGLRPAQPYADWVSSLPLDVSELDQPITLADHQAESRVYLLDETDLPAEEQLSENGLWQVIFENELSAWDEFGDHWPSLSVELFRQWFEIIELPVVFDHAEEPLLRAELA